MARLGRGGLGGAVQKRTGHDGTGRGSAGQGGADLVSRGRVMHGRT
jgi:hypothetical protein